MKRLLEIATILSLVMFVMGVSVIFADDDVQTVPVKYGRAFLDANGDGVCDNFTPGTGQGIGRSGRGVGVRFVDANGDGVCDNFTPVTGQGIGRSGRGVGVRFVDANGDGVCDNLAAGRAALRTGRNGGKGQRATAKSGRGGGR